MPTSRSATTRSSTRPCGASADRSPSVSSPGTRKSASFESSPSSSSRTAPPTRYASSPSPRTYFSISSRIRPFSPDRRRALQQCDRFDLDERAGGKLRHLYSRPRGRLLADVLRVDLVHGLEVVEVLEIDRRLHEAVERSARLLEDRLQVREDLFGLLLDPARDRGVSRLQAELAGDEDEAAGRDRLRVRRALERRRRGLGPDDTLLAHERSSRRSHASASAGPSPLKIASSTCALSVPFRSRTCRTRPAVSASTSRNLRATSVPSPPMRACVRSTFVTNSGSSVVSRTTEARASAEVIAAEP